MEERKTSAVGLAAMAAMLAAPVRYERAPSWSDPVRKRNRTANPTKKAKRKQAAKSRKRNR